VGALTDDGTGSAEPEDERSSACGYPLDDGWLQPYTASWGGASFRGTVESGGMVREFLVELPDPYHPDTAYPLVASYHGHNGSMDSSLGQQLGRSFDYEAIIVHPQGRPGEGVEAIWGLYVDDPDIDFFDALVEDVGEHLCVDRRRIHTWGFSRGGYHANLLACVRGDVINGSSPAGAGMPVPWRECEDPVNQFIVHGAKDPVVAALEGRQATEDWLQIDGCATEPEAMDEPFCHQYAGCDNGRAVVYCEVPDGIHAHHQDLGLQEAAVAFLRAL
jgi:poly(3-hydroxybutyrate) depolymerase